MERLLARAIVIRSQGTHFARVPLTTPDVVDLTH